ncbi:helix-turn-helix domain-containing protein [Nocardiopsis sp. NRRL B-16309]|uniref:helix-turn-helix domain-containing protein n=1 Tax=Nocardiopsis sp. NRRL B-16309 TaxID=1519494 RepID=UPI0006AE421C|nr:helix-turn-helix domain-containing protein [Nocardiopsis sp. NRRL B-16309]KOX07880.1 CdaR family transcriptional regulator [Nocardiopsis sp. NRRL B-16309]
MRELLGRISALDPEAGEAVRVIAYFDSLAGAGVEPLVRGAAVLTGVPAGFVDRSRGVALRVTPEGSVDRAAADPDPSWSSVPVRAVGGVLWLERTGEPGPVGAMVLERASAALRAHLELTGPVQGSREALREVLVDPHVAESVRVRAARRLGIGVHTPVRAVATPEGAARVVAAADAPVPGPERAGVGPAVEVPGLPESWAQARRALRFTAEGRGTDPGPRVAYAEELGGLLVLADAVIRGSEPVPDVVALDRVGRESPVLLEALDAVAAAPSLRAAATALGTHHSTLQEGVGRAERVLGWPVRDVSGRLRLQVALALRRLHRNA